MANDLKGVGVPDKFIEETLACAWEYTRCVIPQFTNWKRYIAFMRLIAIATVTEFRGSLVDVAAGDNILGYDLGELLETVYGGMPAYEEMAREFRAFLLITAEKCSNRRDSDLFRRYVNALVQSPKDWFRLRDCDALLRFTLAAALTCNDHDDVWLSEEEIQVLAEIGDTLYDGVAYYKHRAEGETNSTFGYVGQESREAAFHRCREVLWALDVAWASSHAHQCLLNCLRFFGGPIHMTCRRYRFVEDGLMIGRSETEDVVDKTRENFKLWYRIDSTEEYAPSSAFLESIAQSSKLMFPGLADMLQKSNDGHCSRCVYRQTYGAEEFGQFGGVKLCDGCRENWNMYLESLPVRAAKVFPVIESIRHSGIEV